MSAMEEHVIVQRGAGSKRPRERLENVKQENELQIIIHFQRKKTGSKMSSEKKKNISSIQVNVIVFILYCVYLFGWSGVLIVHSCGLC